MGLRRRRARHDGLGGERELTVRGEADVFVEGSRDRSRRAESLRGGLRDLLLDAVRGQTGPGLSVGHTGTGGASTGIAIYWYSGTDIPVYRYTGIPVLVYPYTGNPNFGRSVLGCIEAEICNRRLTLEHFSSSTRFAVARFCGVLLGWNDVSLKSM